MTPAEIVRDLLKSKAEQLGYEVAANHMPDKPDKLIAVYDMRSGRLQERLARSGEVQERPIVEIHLRDLPHAIAGSVLETLWEEELKPVFRQTVGTKILHCITKTTTMWSLGQEPRTRRVRYVQQFRMTLE